MHGSHTPVPASLARGLIAAAACVLFTTAAVRAEPPVGRWEAKQTIQDQQVDATMTLTRDADGHLTGAWVNPYGETALEDIAYENGKLSFTRHITFGDNEVELTFNGVIEGDTLTGAFTGEFGESPVTAKLTGEPPAAAQPSLAGTWDVTYRGERGGERRATLTIEPDLSGTVSYPQRDLSLPLRDVTLDGDDVTYAYTVRLRDRDFDVNFRGKIAGDALTGRYFNAQGEPFAEVTAARRAPFALRINAGATEDYTDPAGNVWRADRPYAEGGWGYDGGDYVYRGEIDIAGAELDPVYRAERYALNAYRITVPNDGYTVRLHFAETYDGISAAGQRIYDVTVEGAAAASSLDVYKEAGAPNTAIVKTVEAEVADGVLDIEFTSNVQNPMINGIEVISK